MKRVLLVDDHAMVIAGVRALLAGRPDLEVVGQAASGREALEVACATNPDVAIVDYILPEISGCDLTVRLRKLLPAIHVIIYTMHDREDMVLDAYRAGAMGYVLKTDPAEDLLAALDRMRSKHPYLSRSVPQTLLIHAETKSPAGGEGHQSKMLTPREREIVALIAEGRSNKQIARQLSISTKTVETHRAKVMLKLDLTNTAHLVRYALRNNLIKP